MPQKCTCDVLRMHSEFSLAKEKVLTPVSLKLKHDFISPLMKRFDWNLLTSYQETWMLVFEEFLKIFATPLLWSGHSVQKWLRKNICTPNISSDNTRLKEKDKFLCAYFQIFKFQGHSHNPNSLEYQNCQRLWHCVLSDIEQLIFFLFLGNYCEFYRFSTKNERWITSCLSLLRKVNVL